MACLALAACAEAPRHAVPPTDQRPLGWVDVRLSSGTSLSPSCVGPIAILDRSGRQRLGLDALPAGSLLRLRDGRVLLGGDDLGPPPVELRPLGGHWLALGGTRYRGVFRVESAEGSGQLRLVNRLPVDDYLLGVLPREMPDRFGPEALAAQAVAARSYALAEVGRRGWLFPDQRSQVYGGVEAETSLTRRAVERTRNQVLTVDGQVVSAWFHSTCGGGTTPARRVFPSAPRGFLERAVVCPDCRASPMYAWERRIPGARVCQAVGLPSAPLELVSATPSRFPGRPRSIRVVAGGRSASIDAEHFRAAVSAGRPRDEQLLSTRWARPAEVHAGQLLIHGHGWGHGVGMCQYGAAGYAARGASYRAILSRYYVGAELVELK